MLGLSGDGPRVSFSTTPYSSLLVSNTDILVSNAYVQEGRDFGLRRPVVLSGDVVHRPWTRPRLTRFPVAEWDVARANP